MDDKRYIPVKESLLESCKEVKAMGKYKKAGELLEAYIRQAEKLAAEVEDYSSIYDIRAFLAASSLENKESLQAACDRLLESPACTEVTRQAVQQGHDIEKRLSASDAGELLPEHPVIMAKIINLASFIAMSGLNADATEKDCLACERTLTG